MGRFATTVTSATAWIAAAALLAGTGTAISATLEVPGTYPTIYAALTVAAHGDTVSLACGTYHEYVLQIPSGVVLRSATGDPACVTLDAGGHGTLLFGWSVDAETRIEGLTITGGNPFNHGGGLYFSDSDVRISNCILENNETANWGGGIYCEDGSPVVRRCEFRGNAARFSGGGFVAWGPSSNALVEDCLFAGNEGTFIVGGAVLAKSSHVRLVGCTLVANCAAEHGSGVYARVGASVELEQCIVAADTGSEALACDESAAITLACCDVYKNNEGDFTGCVADQQTGNGNFSENPLFCNANEGDYTLRADSPCLPTGSGGCGQVGAFSSGCGAVSVERLGWGSIKARYR